jgi:2-polyprenyl-6-methoxyphenol hydroxylase-like FAD-dependent oxidoreductase
MTGRPVLIAGAGVAGLTLAALLRRHGIEVVVVERRRALERSGYVLGMWPLGSQVLRKLDLYEEFEHISVPLKRYSIADGHGSVLQTYPVEFIAKNYGLIRMIQRGALIELLAGAAGDAVHTGVSCSHAEEDSEDVAVTFSDGTVSRFDAVIGCDGVHSRMRHVVFGAVEPELTGWHGWAWWADPKLARNDTMTEYWDCGRWFCAVYPAHGVLCAFAGLRLQGPSASVMDLEHVRDRLRAMDGIAPGILGYLGASENVFHDAFVSLTMPRWCKGRIALAGDACSAVFPFGGLGIGASMAMESAAVLAEELAASGTSGVAAALDAYERRRKPRAAVFEAASREVIRGMLHPQPHGAGGREIIERQREMFAAFKRLLDQPL